MEKNELRELFARYLNNRCLPEEVSRLVHYFNIADNEQALRGLIEEQLNQPVDEQVEQDAGFTAVLNNAYSNISNEIHKTAKPKFVPVVPFRRRLIMRIAIAASVITVAIALYTFRKVVFNARADVAYKQLITGKGQRKQLQLSDGTTVWLAPGSVLAYPSPFTERQREVTLEGEAFFEVARHTSHPFIVHAGRVHTQVLGTTFTVQAYANEPAVEVTLVTGKVIVNTTVNHRTRQLQLAPDQRAVYNKTTGGFDKEEYPEAAQMIARRDGKFIYKGTPLVKVIRDLQLYYNTVIHLSPGMERCTYYGQFDLNSRLPVILQQLALTYNASIKQANNQWEFIDGACIHN